MSKNAQKLFGVITTIQPPTTATRGLARTLGQYGSELIVIGDKKGPSEYDSVGCELWTLRRQLRLPLTLPRLLPTGHYARKNIGYLVAISRGATCIYETDDDNQPKRNWRPRNPLIRARPISGIRWFNAFEAFTDIPIWPRGFPLEEINPRNRRKGRRVGSALDGIYSPIQQGLADLNPDVDAIWRLVFGARVHFRKNASVALMPGVWCPFNSQTTWWFPDCYPLMYLPSYCSFRMTDIWRSFIAQRCLWSMGGALSFHGSEVTQRRNEHDLIRDFTDEVPGYLANRSICQALENLDLRRGADTAADNLWRCYESLVRRAIFPRRELPLLRAWLKDLQKVSRGQVL